MDYTALADLLFPRVDQTPRDWEKKYPPRDLPPGACVTRFAPSPTGFLHFGALYGALADERLARQSHGRFLLRIDDTDGKRTVPNGDQLLLEGLADFGVCFDEGAVSDGDCGDYGPYRQRQRLDIYASVAKQLVRQGKAYPCFCAESDLAAMRERQMAEKAHYGYHGAWAKHRNASLAEIQENIANGRPFVLRFRAEGSATKTVNCNDLIKGAMAFPENDQDHVLLKSDFVPTYHFAHVVDDHYMRVTHVVRGDEWVASLPLHLQLFEACGFAPPLYAHTATIMKIDGGGKRKLSKRKDPEADLRFLKQEGFPVSAIVEYLMTLLNSDYEAWRDDNPRLPYSAFPFRISKVGVSGALFDMDKLRDVSKNAIAAMTAEEVRQLVSLWANEYNRDFARLIDADADRAREIFSIGRGGEKPRKDISTWGEVPSYAGFFFDQTFAVSEPFPEKISVEDRRAVLAQYAAHIELDTDQTAWFGGVKTLAAALGYTADNKAYKADPGRYKGTVGDYVMVLRVAVCGRRNAPDLFSVMRLLGRQRVADRLARAAERET